MVGNDLVHRFAIVRTVRHHGDDLALERLEQRRDLTGIIRGIVGQHAGDDLAGAGIDRDVELAPGPARPAVLLFIPLALAEELQTGAVDHQLQRAVRDDLGLPPGKTAAAALSVVWSGTRSSCPSSRSTLVVKPSAWRRAR